MMSAAFSSNSGVIAGHVLTDPMGLNTKLAPDTAHARLTNTQFFSQPIAAPVGPTIPRTLTRGLQNTRLGLSRPRPALTTPITRVQSCQTLLLKAPLPLPDILITAIQLLPNFPVRMARCQH